MVLKPSELSPLSAMIWAKVMEDAGVPPGVFNLINGDGATVGAALSSHRDVDMVSFTGSVRAGAEVALNAAADIKRVHQELGGKSPDILLDDADFGQAVASGIQKVMLNSGQSCNAPSRMLVPATRQSESRTLQGRPSSRSWLATRAMRGPPWVRSPRVYNTARAELHRSRDRRRRNSALRRTWPSGRSDARLFREAHCLLPC
jgi:hypothetical protein